MGTLDGKVAFITGAARGQGRSHAVTLAENGADVVVVDIDHDIESVFYPLASRSRPGRDRSARREDRPAGARAYRRRARLDRARCRRRRRDRRRSGTSTSSSANAGIATTMVKTWEMSERDWQDVIDVNLTGVWRTIKAVVPAMIEAERGGCIVLTSSLAGLKGYSNIAGYVAAKHGVNGLMRTLANELGPHNIRVNSVCPGLIHTDMMMNQPTYDIFRPELETRPRKMPPRCSARCRYCRRIGSTHVTSAKSSPGWRPTRPGSSPAPRSQSMPDRSAVVDQGPMNSMLLPRLISFR